MTETCRYDKIVANATIFAGGAVVLAAILEIFANQVIGFFSETDPEMLKIGALAIRLQCLALPIHAWVAVVNMLCAGLGDGKGAVVLSASRQGTCFLPILYPLAWLFQAVGVAPFKPLPMF